jgi:hypothetical protein
MIINNQFVPLSSSIYEKKEYIKTYESMTDILEILSNENTKFSEYTEEDINVFKKLKINTTIDEINNICYKEHKYNKDYSKIINESKYTAEDAINTLLNILVLNLISFIENKKDNEIKIICIFIFNIFKEIDKESSFINKNLNEDDIDSDSNKNDIEFFKEQTTDIIVEDNELDDDNNIEDVQIYNQHDDDSLDSGFDSYGDMAQGTEDE